ncbi:MAG: bifunctional precorrin-2 dehydrogenase/sirohydrochlorin ferrochelatase [Actinomycetota bacterium]
MTGHPPPIPVVPVGLRVEGRDILVVGAGRIAARKAEAYVAQGARVTVVAPDHGPAMDRLPVVGRHHRCFRPSDLDGMWLAVAATGIPEVDGAVHAAAEARRIWCNAADDPEHCSVILPAVTRRGPITVSIGSGGVSPAATGWLRRRLTPLLDDETLAVVEAAARVRTIVRQAGLPTEVPGWAEVLDDHGLRLARDGRIEELERRLLDAVVGQRTEPAGTAAGPAR